MQNPTERFSGRVENYVRYRPSYPLAVVDALIEKCSLDSASLVADVGAGTGIFTALLLEQGLSVAAVEPNREMRLAAEAMLGDKLLFTSVSGSAEKTGLEANSIDLIAAAQAFHWFRVAETLEEFSRILKPTGWLALIWNERKLVQEFQKEYEKLLLEYAPDYSKVNHVNLADDTIAAYFDPAEYEVLTFDNEQTFDKTGFLGRVNSCSYIPENGSSGYLALMSEAERLFVRSAENGQARFEYDTRMHLGKLSNK